MAEKDTLHGLIQNPKWCRGKARIKGGYIVLDRTSAQPYNVHAAEYFDELPFRLARLIRVNTKGAEVFDNRQAMRFVKEYGMLWTGPKHLDDGELREPVTRWERAAKRLRRVIQLYDARREAVRKAHDGDMDEFSKRSEDVDPVRKALHALREEDGSIENVPSKDLECLRYAGDRLAVLVNENREGAEQPVVPAYRLPPVAFVPRGLDDFIYTYRFSDLHAAAYDWLSDDIVRKVPVGTCAECQGPFIVGHGNHDTYCVPGGTCQQRAEKRRQRERQEQPPDAEKRGEELTPIVFPAEADTNPALRKKLDKLKREIGAMGGSQ